MYVILVFVLGFSPATTAAADAAPAAQGASSSATSRSQERQVLQRRYDELWGAFLRAREERHALPEFREAERQLIEKQAAHGNARASGTAEQQQKASRENIEALRHFNEVSQRLSDEHGVHAAYAEFATAVRALEAFDKAGATTTPTTTHATTDGNKQ
jgi:hypothetical protein